MNKYAVVRIQGKQHKVSEGNVILVDKVADPKKIEAETLLFVEGDKVSVGKPALKDVSVKFKVLTDMLKGKKVDVYKYKAKSRYRKHVGFRPQFTELLVEKIS